jgi:hypothetical protein
MAEDTHTFQFVNVPPGRYWVTLDLPLTENGVTTSVGARVPVTVGDTDVTGVDLTLAPMPVIDVAIHAPEGAGSIKVALRDADEPFGATTYAEKQADGSLRIALEHGGRYWLVTRTELCRSAAHLGKSDALDHALEIAPGTKDTLEVTFTDRCGEIRLTAIDNAGKPVPRARTAILLTGTPDDPGDLMLENVGEDGTTSWNGLRPGRYSLWAWRAADEWDGAVDDLAALKAWRTDIEIRAGDKADVRVPLLNSARSGDK